MAALAALTPLPAYSQNFEPVAPGDLNASVNGLVVDLSWSWGNAGTLVAGQSFEDEEFPPAGWDVTATYEGGEGNWLRYDFSDDEMTLAHDGDCAAILMMGEWNEEFPEESHQDEWLIIRPGDNAVYMDFWYYLHPELFDVGGYQDFPDHYYVKISRDNGASWEELWDGRWDIVPTDDVRMASLFLGQPTDGDTLVAFQAVSGEMESLYFLWAVDDVAFYAPDGEAVGQMSATRRHAAGIPSGVATHRSFISQSGVRTNAPARASSDEWLNNGNTTFRVYLDDEVIGDYIKRRSFTDYSAKEDGPHIYSVMAWSEADDVEYDEATVEVVTETPDFAPARNLKVSFTEQEGERYTVEATWEAPEGSMAPNHYNIYINDKAMGWVDATDELAAGQSALFKGIYTVGVEAVYTMPDGSAPIVYAQVTPGTVPAPLNVGIEAGAGVNTLSWTAPEYEGAAPQSYLVYRGNELIGDNVADTSFTDGDAPAGRYYYGIHAVYADGTVSLPASVTYGDEPAVAALPYVESFDGAHLPADWTVVLSDPRQTVKDMYSWRFDNWFDIAVAEGLGFSGDFASISSVAAGMNRLESHLVTPPFVPELLTAVKFVKYYDGPVASESTLFQLQASADGETWDLLADLTSCDNGPCIYSLADYEGQRIQLRWSVLSRNAGVAAVDNVEVCESVSVDEVVVSPLDDVVDVFTPAGVRVAEKMHKEQLKSLAPGLYILRGLSGSRKYIAR